MEAILAAADDEYEGSAGTVETVNEYVEVRGGVSMPRDYARRHYSHLNWHDNTVMSHCAIKYGVGPAPRDEAQKLFFGKLLMEASQPGHQDILANAATGAGKSVAGVWLGQHLRTPTLILVDQTNIGKGWVKNMTKFYGAAWVKEHVGWVQQDRCDYEGKAFCVALVQSIVRRDYGPDFYNYFGLVIFDEVQVYGTPHFSKALGMFPARVRVGFTAENRGGAFGRLIKAHLGDTRVVSHQEVMQARAYLIQNKLTSVFYAQSDGAILTGLSRVDKRNTALSKLIKERGYDRGRQVLVLSDRTAHLVELRERCIALGIPPEDMGLYIGTYTSRRYEAVYTYGKNALPLAVFETLKEAQAVVKLLRKGLPSIALPKALVARLKKDKASVKFGYRPQRYSPDQIELDNITNSCQIVFATYRIFSKGVDVPRLDMGVEALPSGNLKQPLGRILRLHEGKPSPEWYAICDTVELDEPFNTSGNPAANLLNLFLHGKTRTRIAALKRANAKISRVK
jgi:hypothetical protein